MPAASCCNFKILRIVCSTLMQTTEYHWPTSAARLARLLETQLLETQLLETRRPLWALCRANPDLGEAGLTPLLGGGRLCRPRPTDSSTSAERMNLRLRMGGMNRAVAAAVVVVRSSKEYYRYHPNFLDPVPNPVPHSPVGSPESSPSWVAVVEQTANLARVLLDRLESKTPWRMKAASYSGEDG